MEKFATYNALNRNPLIAGVPIITLIIFVALILLTAVIGVLIFGDLKAVILPAILAGGLFFIKIVCESDSRAMDKLWWNTKGFIYKLRCRSTVTSFTSSYNDQKQRKKNIYVWFKNNTDS